MDGELKLPIFSAAHLLQSDNLNENKKILHEGSINESITIDKKNGKLYAEIGKVDREIPDKSKDNIFYPYSYFPPPQMDYQNALGYWQFYNQQCALQQNYQLMTQVMANTAKLNDFFQNNLSFNTPETQALSEIFKNDATGSSKEEEGKKKRTSKISRQEPVISGSFTTRLSGNSEIKIEANFKVEQSNGVNCLHKEGMANICFNY